MAAGSLAGKVAVLALGGEQAQAPAIARRLASEGAAVVLVAGEGDDDAVAGASRLAADLQGLAARTAVFTLTGAEPADLDALVELLGELFR